MRIVFMGTPDFAKESLQAIYEAKHEILAVVTNIDKPQGRGMHLVASPVKEFAIKNNIKVIQPEKIRNNEAFISELKELKPEVICVVAYGKILPKEVLDIPEKGCINVHGSILPQYRGAAPIQWAVINGDKTTGITTMYMDTGMDTGDIILKEKVEIGPDETTGELWNRLAKVGAELLVKTLNEISNGTATRTPQPDNFTIAPMLTKEIAKIDWENKSAVEIKNLVRGLNPIMGAYSYLNEKKYKFWRVDAIENDVFFEMYEEFAEYAYKLNNVQPGTILLANEKKGMFIQTKKGILSVSEIQGENAKKMQISDFLRGNKLQFGEIFE